MPDYSGIFRPQKQEEADLHRRKGFGQQAQEAADDAKKELIRKKVSGLKFNECSSWAQNLTVSCIRRSYLGMQALPC